MKVLKNTNSNPFGKSTFLDPKNLSKFCIFLYFPPCLGWNNLHNMLFLITFDVPDTKKYHKPTKKMTKHSFPSHWMANYLFQSFSSVLGEFLIFVVFKILQKHSILSFFHQKWAKKMTFFFMISWFFWCPKIEKYKKVWFYFFFRNFHFYCFLKFFPSKQFNLWKPNSYPKIIKKRSLWKKQIFSLKNWTFCWNLEPKIKKQRKCGIDSENGIFTYFSTI